MTIVEREKLDAIRKELELVNTTGFKKGSGARTGELKGADAIVMGNITTFGRDDKESVIGGGGGVPIPFLGAGLRLGKREEKAVVVINYRIVDAESGEVIDSGEARGESLRKGKVFGFVGGVSGVVGGGGVAAMTSANFAETIIGEAVMKACDTLAAIMHEKVSGLTRRAQEVEARVAAIDGSKVTINAGTNYAVNVQDSFDVFRVVGEVKDPVTGEIIDLKLEPWGGMVVTSVRERTAEGTYTGKALSLKLVQAGILVRRRS
jgi:curli biogenesis system outer membrane secretion channel CsgG